MGLLVKNTSKSGNYNDLVSNQKRIRIKAEVSELKFDSFTAYETIKLV
jgi:hypothetical protein